MPSLWLPQSWPKRLEELTAAAGDLKLAPLRRDVRSLGMLLGVVLREQAEPGVYEDVEALRQSAIARRERSDSAPSAAFLGNFSESDNPLRAYQLARAFSFYFELINLAETNHRKRRRLAPSWTDGEQAARVAARRLRVLRESGSHLPERCSRRWGRSSYARVHGASHRGGAALRHVQAPAHLRPAGRSWIAFRCPGADGRAAARPADGRLPRCGRPTTCAANGRRCATRSAWRWTTTSRALRHAARAVRRGGAGVESEYGAALTACRELPTAGRVRLLDRRRPRRQPVRDAGGDARALEMARDLLVTPLPATAAEACEQIAARRSRCPFGRDCRRGSTPTWLIRVPAERRQSACRAVPE